MATKFLIAGIILFYIGKKCAESPSNGFVVAMGYALSMIVSMGCFFASMWIWIMK